MSDNKVVKPLALAVGAALASSFAFGSSIANADTVDSPFVMSSLSAGYLLGEEGSCGGDKGSKEAEGSCGGDKKEEGSCGGDKHEEGSCGGDKDAEGSCGEGKKDGEGSCGEGSCGADKE